MSTLLFVRHAQASLFDADYDQLSDLGRDQAKRLGKHFEEQGIAFDEIYVGPRRRHRQTAAIVAQFAATRSVDAAEIPEFDEHQVDRLVTQHTGKIAVEFPQIGELEVAYQAAESLRERQRSFARLFEAVADLWVSGRCPLDDVESWPEFRERVNQGVNRVIEQGGQGRSVLVFGSAGTVVATLHRALRCPADVALGLGWRLWNCSLTTFVFSADRFSLDQFNTTPHLSHGERTYR